MGGKIRDTEDEFQGADFRDEATKLLFAYDYQNRFTLRVWGTTFKPALYGACRQLGVTVLDRTMATSLLSEDGRQGARVVGATGVHTRTGRFFDPPGKSHGPLHVPAVAALVVLHRDSRSIGIPAAPVLR